MRIVGADGDAPLTVREVDMRGPLAIVIGSEGRGLNARVRRRVDIMARIPMRGHVASLNASVAGSVFLFEAATQRWASPPPPPSGALDREAEEQSEEQSESARPADEGEPERDSATLAVGPDAGAPARLPDAGAVDAEATLSGQPSEVDGLPMDDEDLLPA